MVNGSSPLLRSRWGGLRWWMTHPRLWRSVVAVAVLGGLWIGGGAVLAVRGDVPPASPAPTVTIVRTASPSITYVTSSPTPAKTMTVSAKPQPGKTVTVSAKPNPGKTVTVKPVPPKTTTPKQTTYTKLLTCAYEVTLTANGSGQGKVTTKIIGPVSRSGTSTVTVSGGPGVYKMQVTDSAGHPRLSFNYEGCI